MSIPAQKNSPRWAKNFNIKFETLKLLDTGISKDFQNRTLVAWEIR